MRPNTSTKAPRAVLPTTSLGWWALRLAGFAVVMMFAMPLQEIPYFGWVIWGLGWLGLAAALVGGVLAPIAIIRDKERALSVFAAVIPLLFYLVFVVLELTVFPEH